MVDGPGLVPRPLRSFPTITSRRLVASLPQHLVRDLEGLDPVFTGTLALDLLLGDVHSLKEKRGVVRPIVAELKRFGVSVAEAGHLDLHRRALIGVAVVAADAQHVKEVLDRCERLVGDRPEVEVLSAHQALFKEGDD